MKNSIPIILILTIFNISTVTVNAAQLNKFGSSDYRYPTKTYKQSRRNKLINRALRDLNSATTQERNQLITDYRNLKRQAIEAKNYRNADFYQQILNRAGN